MNARKEVVELREETAAIRQEKLKEIYCGFNVSFVPKYIDTFEIPLYFVDDHLTVVKVE